MATSNKCIIEDEAMEVDQQDMYLGENSPITQSAPLVETVQVEIKWHDQIKCIKSDKSLQKALQSFFNKTSKLWDVKSVCIMPKEDSALATITPVSALDVLLSIKSCKLKFKDLDMEVEVTFSQPSAAEKPQSSYSSSDQRNVLTHVFGEGSPAARTSDAVYRDHMPKDSLRSVESPEIVHKEPSSEGARNGQNLMASNTTHFGTDPVSGNSVPVTCDVPLFHYWHLSKVYSKEIGDIQKKHGVTLTPMVSVVITPLSGKNKEGAAEQAHHEFADLVQKSAPNLGCVSLPARSLKSDFMKEMLKEISKEQAKLQLNVSALGCELSGPISSVHHLQRRYEVYGGNGEASGQMDMRWHASPRRGIGFEEEEEKVLMEHPRDMSRKGGGADGTAAAAASAEEDDCPICLDTMKNKQKLPCSHGFCAECLRRSVASMGSQCPVCKKIFGKVEGDQPDGEMQWFNKHHRLPGFPKCGTIEIHYSIPGGIQSERHPSPGRWYSGTQRVAYLPDNLEGRDVLKLLKKAFDQRLIFTVGVSRTTGARDTVTWNDIHHKTSVTGGPSCFGYPDRDYLKRVKEELKAKGIE